MYRRIAYWLKKKRRANIMLLVLFIMLVSSLLGLLVSQYVSNLIRVSKLFHDYYKSYYISYGGLELGLTQTKYHGYGFEDSLVYNDYSACLPNMVCSFTMDIDARAHVLADTTTEPTNCTGAASGDSYHEIPEGEAFIVPLFRDSSTGFDTESYEIVDSSELSGSLMPVLAASGTASETYTIKVVDENLENYNTTIEGTVNSPPRYAFAPDLGGYSGSVDNKNYLVIANPTGDTKHFCLEVDGGATPLPTTYVMIDSIGRYGGSIVTLRASKAVELPSYLVYGNLN